MRLTLRQKQFTKKYIEYNGNATKAVMHTYNTTNKNSAGVIGSKLLRNAKVNEYINSRVEPEESTLVYLVENLKYLIDYGSWSVKAKAIQLAFKLHGVL